MSELGIESATGGSALRSYRLWEITDGCLLVFGRTSVVSCTCKTSDRCGAGSWWDRGAASGCGGCESRSGWRCHGTGCGGRAWQ